MLSTHKIALTYGYNTCIADAFFFIVQGIEQRMSVGDDVNPPPTQVPRDHVHMHGDVIHSHPHDHPHDHSHDHSHDHHDHDHDHAHLPLDTQLQEKTVQVEPVTEPSTDGIQFLGPSGRLCQIFIRPQGSVTYDILYNINPIRIKNKKVVYACRWPNMKTPYVTGPSQRLV